MFDFEDEFIIEPGVSWLIWIQLLVIILIFALYCLSIFAVDFSDSSTTHNRSTAAIASSSTTTFASQIAPIAKNLSKHNLRIGSNRRSRSAQVNIEQSISGGEIVTSTSSSRRIVQVGEDSAVGGGEGCQETRQQLDLHPCSYFRLAKSAFLRCLGLDSSTENSVSSSDEGQRRESRKSKES